MSCKRCGRILCRGQSWGVAKGPGSPQASGRPRPSGQDVAQPRRKVGAPGHVPFPACQSQKERSPHAEWLVTTLHPTHRRQDHSSLRRQVPGIRGQHTAGWAGGFGERQSEATLRGQGSSWGPGKPPWALHCDSLDLHGGRWLATERKGLAGGIPGRWGGCEQGSPP